MKEVLSLMFLHIIEIHAPSVYSDINGGSDDPTSVHHNIPPGPDSEFTLTLRATIINFYL